MRTYLLRSLVLTLVLSGMAFGQLDSGSAYVPDIETFLQIGSIGTPEISEDGRRVFFVANMSGVSQLYRITDDGWPYQLTVYPDGVDFYALAPDGMSAVVGASVGGDEQSQLIWIDGTTGRPRQLTEKPDVQYGSVSYDTNGEGLFYRSNEANGRDFHVYHRNLTTGVTRPVFVGEGYHVPSVQSHSGRWLVVEWYESNMNSTLHLVDLEGGNKTRELTPHKDPAIYSAGGFSTDDVHLYIFTDDNDDGVLAPVVMNLESGKISSPFPKSRWEVEGGGMSPDGRYAGVIYNEEGYGRLHLWDLAVMKELPVPQMDGIVSGVEFAADGSCVIAFSSPTKAPNLWTWDWRKPELKQISHTIYAGIDPAMFRDPELVKIKSYDGLEMPAFLYLPPGYTKGEPVPFVIDIHGGPEAQFRPYFIRNFQYMMLNGYGVLAPNVRGSSGYGKDYQSLDNYKLRMNSVKDAGAWARWLIDEGYTTQDMLGVRGGSYGGFMVLACITEFPDLFAAAIDIVGIANFQTFLENTKPYRRALREAEYGPLTDPDFLASVSPIYKVDRIRTPLLVVHGENDPRVPVGEARQIAEAIATRGGAVDTLIFPDEGHGASKRSNVLLEYRRHVDFFNKYLKKEGK
jgi:dipeptidyl aminopeptidase/acylaminoacyl peptidase